MLQLVMGFVEDPPDREAASLVCRWWHRVDALSRKHVTVPFCYAVSPARLLARFPQLESLTMKGKPRTAMYGLIPDDWGVYARPWVTKLAVPFECLKALHLRSMVVIDDNLAELIRARGHMLQELKLDKCTSFSTDGLRLVARSWSLGNSGSLPTLLPDEVRKLKQLSVLPLVESTKILPYDQLMQELDVSNVRELEDFLINECMYSGIVRGKLDQLRRCLTGRDLTPDQLNNMIEILSDWFGTSDSLLHQIQEKIKWADTMSDVNKKHRKEFEDRVEEAKKSIKADIDIRGHDDYLSESVGIMDFEEDRVRPK
ncbi:hypothetical protein ACJX0J_012781, partial [Zea mays]